jgi:hypothetical protein
MFLVEWEPEASDAFAAISMDHVDRWKDINSADNDIVNKLERNPLHYSQPVSEGLRRIVCEPLAVYFSVENDLVTVQGVRWVS